MDNGHSDVHDLVFQHHTTLLPSHTPLLIPRHNTPLPLPLPLCLPVPSYHYTPGGTSKITGLEMQSGFASPDVTLPEGIQVYD